MKQSYWRSWSSGGEICSENNSIMHFRNLTSIRERMKELRSGGEGFEITYMQHCPWRHMGMKVEERQSKSTSQKVQKTHFE